MGPIHTVRFFRPAPGSHLEAVRLKAEWCRDLLGCDPGEHADGWTALPAASRRRLRGLLDRLAATRSSEAAVQVLLDAIAGLAEQCEPGRSTRLAHDALEVVRAGPTASADLAERARALGVSSRHLRRAVRATTGRGPKRFHRVRRLQHAVSLAEAGTDRRLGWAGLAVDAGFYDQAHLIQEFRELTGATPLELRSERALQATPSASSSSQPAGW
jgi:AraC-like DNA-binding protein